MDDAGFLEHFGEAGRGTFGQIHHGLGLQAGSEIAMVVETGVGGAVVAKIAPSCRMRAGAEINPPEQTAGRQRPQLGVEFGEPLRVRLDGNPGRHNCRAIAITTSGSRPDFNHDSGLSGPASVSSSGSGALNQRHTETGSRSLVSAALTGARFGSSPFP